MALSMAKWAKSVLVCRVAKAIRHTGASVVVALVIMVLMFDICDGTTWVQNIQDKYSYTGGTSNVFQDEIRSGYKEDILKTVPDVINIYMKLFVFTEKDISLDSIDISSPQVSGIDKRYSIAYGEITCDEQILEYAILLDNNYNSIFNKVNSWDFNPPYEIKYADAMPLIFSRSDNRQTNYQFDLQRVSPYRISKIHFDTGAQEYFIEYSVDVIRILVNVLVAAGVCIFSLKRRSGKQNKMK